MMSTDSIGFDSVLGLCGHQHRRIVLGTLADEQRSLTLDDLTKAVLKCDHQTPLAEAPEDVQSDIRISLHHLHLPKLASDGLITYDPERQVAEPTEQFDEVHPTLSTILDLDSSFDESLAL